MSYSKRRDSKGRILFVGEIQEKSGRYKYRYSDGLGGRRTIYSWRLTKADKMPDGKKLERPLREIEAEIQKEILQGITQSDMTVIQLVEKYLKTKTGVRHNTKANYRFVQNILAKEPFGKMKIKRIKISDAKLFLIKLQKEGRRYSTIHVICGVLRPEFQMAVDDDNILKNPFQFELSSVIVNDTVPRQALTKDNEKRFLEFIKCDKHYSHYYDAFYLLFNTGLRISEFCGLTINDIDFKNNYINVDHQLQRTRDMVYVIEKTKTTAGTRKIPMDDDVKNAFKRIIENRKTPKIEPMVDGYAGFLFLDKNNKPIVALHWEKYMKRAVEKYNEGHKLQLPTITPHVCRHTYCSNMAKAGINPKTFQYLMGHSEIGVTLNTYTHIGFEDAKDELERMKTGTVNSKIV